MEYCDGGNLTTLFSASHNSETLIPESDILLVLACLLKGQLSLIKHGVIHRDIKLENVMKSGDIWKLGDFGLATILGTKSLPQALAGTEFTP